VPDPVVGLRSAEHQILDWFVISGDRSTEQYRQMMGLGGGEAVY
jgi:hypothetical protein